MAVPESSSTPDELTSSPSGPSRHIFGTGEMADLVRAFDWSATPLGPIPTWNETLLTCVNLLLSSRHPMFLWWGPDLIQFYNDAYRPSFGRGKHPSALGQPARDCWTEIWDIIQPRTELVMGQGQATWYENQIVPTLRNGQLEEVYWTWSDSPVHDAQGNVVGIFVTCSETTDRVLTERNLRESQRIGRMGSWHLVLATGKLTWSQEVYRLLEHDPTLPVLDYAKQPELMEPDSLRRLTAAVEQCITTAKPYELDTKMYLPSGKTVWLATRGEPILSAEGKVVELRGTVRDITDRKLAEEALRDSEERLRLALSAARDMGSFDWDILPDRCIADPRFCAIYGIDPELGRRGLLMVEALAHVHPEDWPEVEARARHTMETGEDFVMDYRVQSTSTTVRWVSARGTCLRAADGTPLRFTGVILDITERKLTEQALLRTEKLAAVGRLASSIAHEINNPLESVTNLIYLARDSAHLEESREYLAMADAELRRASAITTQTLRFHRQSTRPTEVTCEELISTALHILRSRIVNANITVEKRKLANRPILCFDGEIRQVISNLIVNALDAMHPRGGRLILRSREGHDATTQRPGLFLTIADNGTGMTPETISKAFEPFYTTKGIGGTGLGLWISKEIIDRHQGHIHLRSSQHPTHPGTVFTLFLPFEATTR